MSIHQLKKTQFINRSLEEVWKFFSDPRNLATITPPYMKFTVTSGDLPDVTYPGQIITYTVSPVLRVPLFWMTEITHVIPGKLFVDEQRRGPYRLWHHQHHFEQQGDGVLMTDIIHYQLPMGILGDLANIMFVKSQLEDIFDFRREKVEQIFK